MALSSWLCASNSKNMLVKIVHPGGRVELHDRPIMAAEIILQNPRCYVTYPEVFRQPWAVLPPDSVLLLGHKYYVVPAGTLRRLQRAHYSSKPSTSPSLSPINSPNNSLSPLPSPSPSSVEAPSGTIHGLRAPHPGEGEDGSKLSFCWFFSNKDMISSKASYNSLSKSSDDHLHENDGSCLTFLFPGHRARVLVKKGTRTSSDQQRQLSSSETRELVNSRENLGGEAKSGVSIMGHWQPNLESIREEPPC